MVLVGIHGFATYLLRCVFVGAGCGMPEGEHDSPGHGTRESSDRLSLLGCKRWALVWGYGLKDEHGFADVGGGVAVNKLFMQL